MAKRTAGGSPLKRCMPLTQVGLPLDYAHPEPSHRHTLLPSGPRPAFRSGAVPQSIEAGEGMRSDRSPEDYFISEQPGGIPNVADRSGRSESFNQE